MMLLLGTLSAIALLSIAYSACARKPATRRIARHK